SGCARGLPSSMAVLRYAPARRMARSFAPPCPARRRGRNVLSHVSCCLSPVPCLWRPAMTPVPVGPLELLDVDHLLSDEERAVQQSVRRLVDDAISPNIAQWYEAGIFPPEMALTFGKLGLFGMHLQGYGCAGMSAVAYGLACMELEAGDSGARCFVSVQGSLAMVAIHRWGSEEQKHQWLPRMATGEILGCFGLTEPDFGSDPAGMRTRARRDGQDWVLDGTKMWITNGSTADLAVVWARTEAGIQGFLVP